MKIQVAIADDHTLLRSALARLIGTFDNYAILFEAENGKAVKTKLTQHIIPDVLLLDVNMPGMDGYETVKWMYQNYPQVKVLALSMYSDEKTIIKMLRLGAKGYILKNIEPDELKNALDSVIRKSFYLSDHISGKIVSGLNRDEGKEESEVVLTEKETEFLRHLCAEITYKEIASKMFVSPRTVDEYRNHLFDKLKVKSRVGLVIYAMRHGLVEES
jgi:two-component system, NarL family, invasion response regulator UvrY